MSYDTTVHDALEPPQPRVAETRAAGSLGPVRWLVQRRLIAMMTLAAISLAALGGVTWTVARLSGPPYRSLVDDAEAAPLSLPQSSVDLSTRRHGQQ